MAVAHPYIFGALLYLLKAGALEKEEPFEIVSQTTGADSLVESPQVLQVTDLPGWVAVWRMHRQSAFLGPQGSQPQVLDDRPPVDFDKNALLCIFAGQSRNVAGFVVTETGLDKAKDTIVVRIKPVPLNAPAAVVQNPYVIVMFPKNKHKLQIQLDQTLMGGQGWRVLGNFSPTKSKSAK